MTVWRTPDLRQAYAVPEFSAAVVSAHGALFLLMCETFDGCSRYGTMHTSRYDHERGATHLRLLVLDGSPGAAALLVLSAQGAIARFDYVLAVDTGFYPRASYRYLFRLERLAADAGIDFAWADALGVADQTRGNAHPCPLPLFTRAADGTPGRLPNRCARRQSAAMAVQVRSLLDRDHPGPLAEEATIECALGLSIEHADRATTTAALGLRLDYPLIDIGWSAADCRAYLHHHDLADVGGLACLACPERSDAGWAELRATDPDSFDEAVAVDAAIRHGHPLAALRGMPRGTMYYLHSDRVPLDQVTLDPQSRAEVEGCLPRACRRHADGTHPEGGDTA